ncbi:type IV pili twitching motility protein PilT, partial [Methylococcaceae bacterium CS3]
MDFEKLLELMCTKKASDLFITAERPPALKVDGKIIDVSKTSPSEEQSLKLVKSIMTQRQRDDFDNTKECNFAISLGAPCYLTKFRDSCRRNSFTYAA